MKFPICLFFAVLCFSSAFGLIIYQAFEKLRDDQKHCIQQTGVSMEHLELARLDRRIYEDEYQEKFAVCMLKKLNIMKMDGSINNYEPSQTLLTDNPDSFRAAEKCRALAGANVHETARKIMTCLLQTDIAVMDPVPSLNIS